MLHSTVPFVENASHHWRLNSYARSGRSRDDISHPVCPQGATSQPVLRITKLSQTGAQDVALAAVRSGSKASVPADLGLLDHGSRGAVVDCIWGDVDLVPA